MSMHADLGIKRISIDAVVTRADGTVEDLGTVSEWSEPSPPDDPARRRLMPHLRRTKGPTVALSDKRDQPAQDLFDAWKGDLQGLYAYLSTQNIDANTESHQWIRSQVEADADNGNVFAQRALGKKG